MSEPDHPVVIDRKIWDAVWVEIHKICPTEQSLVVSVRYMREQIEWLRGEVEWLRDVNSHLKGLKE